ncbi:Membrane magnesium transporter [Capsicum annuum]|nr:Membrane magnesium transporter [Capsicum annuum]
MGAGFLVGLIGVLILSHATYSTIQYRALLKITEEEFSGPPIDVVVELIVSLVLCLWAAMTAPGSFKSIHPHSEENRFLSLLVVSPWYLIMLVLFLFVSIASFSLFVQPRIYRKPLYLLKGQLARTSTNFTGYLPPPTNNRHQLMLSTKARIDGKKSPSVCLWWELNLRPHGVQPNFIELLGHTLGAFIFISSTTSIFFPYNDGPRDKMKLYHDKKIEKKVFQSGDMFLLYNSSRDFACFLTAISYFLRSYNRDKPLHDLENFACCSSWKGRKVKRRGVEECLVTVVFENWNQEVASGVVALPANLDFMIFNHRGKIFPLETELKLK